MTLKKSWHNPKSKHKVPLTKDILIIKDLFGQKNPKLFRSKDQKTQNIWISSENVRRTKDTQGSMKLFVMFSYCKSSSRRGTNTDAEFWNTSKRLRMNVLLTKNNLKASEKLNSNEILFKVWSFQKCTTKKKHNWHTTTAVCMFFHLTSLKFVD